MSLPFSQARRGVPSDASPTTSKIPPGTTSTCRVSTSQSSNRPISTSSRGFSITSKNSLPEKQLLSRYRHVYAGKGGWFQGRATFAPPANYSSGSSSRHLDVYRKELIMRLSKDIFENSKQKTASPDYVVSNKVAGDPDGDVHNITTKLGENAAKTITSVESHSPVPITPHLREDSARNQRVETAQRQIKPTFHSLNSSRNREQSASKNPIRINLRGGSTKDNQNSPRRLNATSTAGYRLNTIAKHQSTPSIDDLTSSRTETNEKACNNSVEILSEEQKADPDCDQVGLATVDEANNLDHNDPQSNYLFSAFKRSNTIHMESFKKRNIANNSTESNADLNKDSNQDYGNEVKGINDNPNDTLQCAIDKHRSTGDRQSKYLTNEVGGRESFVNSQKQDNTKTHSSVKRTIENNSQDKAELQASASKSAKRNKISAKSKHIRQQEQFIENVLGEIQFNVLRQRSFIRVPKNVTKVLDNVRTSATRGTDNGGTDSRPLLSRMSLSQEARDALQETRKEMKLETAVDLDKYDLRKLNSRENKRPSTPKPESPKTEPCSRASTESFVTLNDLHNSPVKRNHGPQDKQAADLSLDSLDGEKIQNNTVRTNSKKKLDIPSVQYTLDSSKDKFNQTIENDIQRRANPSRASTVATPITDLIPAMPQQQREGIARYSTNMSRDTPRNSQRNTDKKTRRLTAGAIATTRTHLTVPNETRNGTVQTKNAKNSYTVPLKSSSEELHASGKKTASGLPTDTESIKSDWESQLRAMSKYGLVTEKSFQITPPGWDERYKDLANKNSGKYEKDTETSLAEVKEKAIEKCSDWLQKYS